MDRKLIVAVGVGLALVAGTIYTCGDGGGERRTSIEWGAMYDEAGWLASLTTPAGQRIEFREEHDTSGRLTRSLVVVPGADPIRTDYDSFGRAVLLKDEIGELRHSYDEFGRLAGSHRSGEPELTYKYDASGRVARTGVGQEYFVETDVDFLERLSRITTPLGSIGYEYHGGQRAVVRTFPNGVRTVWQFSEAGALESLSHVAADNHVLLRFAYTYAGTGAIASCMNGHPMGSRPPRTPTTGRGA